MNRNVRRGNVIWVKFDPALGCEIPKGRPAIVLSADGLNTNSTNEIVIAAPLTSLLDFPNLSGAA